MQFWLSSKLDTNNVDKICEKFNWQINADDNQKKKWNTSKHSDSQKKPPLSRVSANRGWGVVEKLIKNMNPV